MGSLQLTLLRAALGRPARGRGLRPGRRGEGAARRLAARLRLAGSLPLRARAALPLTDSFGVAFEALALAAGVLVLVRGPRWLAPWAFAVLGLSFTRDASVIAVAGGLVALVVRPSRTSGLLALTGVAASLPAPLAFGAPVRQAMAYTLNGFSPPPQASWSFVAHHYLSGAHSLVKNNL